MCLDSHTAFRLTHGLPPPKDCELFYVDRDALFSYHKVRESVVKVVCAELRYLGCLIACARCAYACVCCAFVLVEVCICA